MVNEKAALPLCTSSIADINEAYKTFPQACFDLRFGYRDSVLIYNNL